jgi:hypothetical protein
MLLQSRLDHQTTLLIDTEPVGGVNKEELDVVFHPDDALDHVVQIAAGVAKQLAVAAAGVHTAVPQPGEFELEFGLKIDSNSTVSIARSAGAGQFQVRVRWAP